MNITLDDGRTELWQWDTGRKIVVDDKSVSEVHYSKYSSTQAITRKVIDGKAEIPNFLLQDTHAITVYAYSGSIENGYTMAEKTFNVIKKPKPANYVETEEDQAILAKLKAEIGDLTSLQTNAKDNLVVAINEVSASGGADWAQNNSEAKDYIRNRPEYLIDSPAFTCRLRIAEAGEDHYGVYSSESEDLSYNVRLWIAGVCYYASNDDKEKLWAKIDGHLFEMNIYYAHNHYNISYMKNEEEIFVQSWLYYGFLDDRVISINFNEFFNSVGIKEIKDPDFSFYTVKPCPAPSKMFSGYTDFSTSNVEYLVYLNFGEFPNTLDKIQISNETFYDVPCISKGESVAKYIAGSYTIAIERYKDSPDSFRWSYRVTIDPDVDDVIFYSKIGTKWVATGGTFEIIVVDAGTPNSDGAFTVTLDKTFAEIDAAVKDGKTPIVIMEEALILPMVGAATDIYI